MLATDSPSSDPLALDLALQIVEAADTWAVEDDASPKRHSPNLAVIEIAQRLLAEDADLLGDLAESHMANPKRRETGRSLAVHEWRQARPAEWERIVIRLDLSRANTPEKRAEIEGWLAATHPQGD